MSTAARKPAARLPRPAARYWKGKAPKGADAALESDSDYDEDAEQQQAPQEEGDEQIRDVGGDGYGEDSDVEEEDGLTVRREAVGKDRKSTRLNSSHSGESRMPSSA